MALEFLPLRTSHIYDVLNIEELSFPKPWTRKMFEREICMPISQFFVARHQYRIIGYVGYWEVDNEAHIVNLAVHPKFRRRGFGKSIMEFLLKNASKKGLSKVLLEVRQTNTAAQRLYESKGFSIVGFRPKYYKNEAAFLMERSNEYNK